MRGTVWLVQDSCDGTRTSVVEGVVDVFDTTLNTTTAVGPGQSYLAKPPAKKATTAKKGSFKPPTSKSGNAGSNNATSVFSQPKTRIERRGLRWAHQTFLTRTPFETWLVERGRFWETFKTIHPAAAAALTARH